MNDFIAGMRAAGKLAASTLLHVKALAQPGVTTNQLDKAAYDYILANGATPAPLNYKGYPKSICTSVNEFICHGVPNDIPLAVGDSINIDVTVLLNGYHGDTSVSMIIGLPDTPLIEAARRATELGISAIRPGNKTGDIGFAVNKFVTRSGFAVVPEIGGHGIGKVFHDSPWIPSTGKKGRGDLLVPGTCITVEPLVVEKSGSLEAIPIQDSQIEIYRLGGILSAQFEHTVLITEDGYEILT